MGRAFKTGLISGVVLGFVALIWVATRPSLSPQARMLGPSTESSREDLPLESAPPRSDEGESADPAVGPEFRPGSTLPSGLTAAEPETATEPSPRPDRTMTRQARDRRLDEQDTARYEREEKIETTRFHIVQRGETLSSISLQYYGSATRWQRILEANQDTINDANKITPGTKLIIPE